MGERNCYLRLRGGVTIHREGCPVIGQPVSWQWKGPFSETGAVAFAYTAPATVIQEICAGDCEPAAYLGIGGTFGWPADQAIAFARDSVGERVVALHLAWFAVVETMQDLAGFPSTTENLHTWSPETLTQPDQPFNRFVDPEVLVRLRNLGQTIDGLKFEEAGVLGDFDRASAIEEARRFVDSAPERFERIEASEASASEVDRLMAMTGDDGLVMQLVRTDLHSHFATRREGGWVPLDDLAELEDLAFVGTTSRALDVWDSCEAAGLHISIKHYPSSIDGPFWPEPVLIDDDDFIYDEETGEYHRPDGVIEEDLYVLEFLGPDKQSARLDYKATLRTDPDTGAESRSALDRCVKTIAGFLNARGGTLLIGVADDGTVHGIESDYASRPNPDKEPRVWFQKHIRAAVSISMTDDAASRVRTQIHHVRGRDVCRVQIAPSPVPVRAEVPVPRPGEPGRDEFFVRIGGSTRSLAPGDQEHYIAQRWP